MLCPSENILERESPSDRQRKQDFRRPQAEASPPSLNLAPWHPTEAASEAPLPLPLPQAALKPTPVLKGRASLEEGLNFPRGF